MHEKPLAAGPAPQAERQPSAPVPVARDGPAGVLTLQRTIGNAAVNRLMRRPRMPTPSLEVLQAQYDEARKAREAYGKSGVKGPVTYDPTTRNKQNSGYGGFDATYDPDKQVLTIKLGFLADFQSGIILNAKGKAVARDPNAATKTEADRINTLPAADRANEVKKWQWSKAGGLTAGDEAKFMTDYKTTIEAAWKGKHAFRCSRLYWEDLGATVAIEVTATEKDDTHGPGSPHHVHATIYKVPPGHTSGGAFVSRSGKAKGPGGAFRNTMLINSEALTPGGNRLRRRVDFKAGSAAIDAKTKTMLQKLGADMPNRKGNSDVEVNDLTITVPGASAEEKTKRFDAIKAILTGKGMDAARLKFVDGGAGDRAEILIGSGEQQGTAVHETGHVFGLDDEYPSDSAEYKAGKKTETTGLAAGQGQYGVMHARSDSVMSNGMTVRRQHYATFLDALKVVSGIEEWVFGDPEKVYMRLPREYAPLDPYMPLGEDDDW